MANKNLWNTTYRYWANTVHLSIYLFHVPTFFLMVGKKGLRGALQIQQNVRIKCSPYYPTQLADRHSRANSPVSLIPVAALDIPWCWTKHIRVLLKVLNLAYDLGPLVSKMKLLVLGSLGLAWRSANLLKEALWGKRPTNISNKSHFFFSCLSDTLARPLMDISLSFSIAYSLQNLFVEILLSKKMSSKTNNYKWFIYVLNKKSK